MARIDGRWVAVQVHGLREVATAQLLEFKGYESFLPLTTANSSKVRSGSKPLFPGYVFCRLSVRIADHIIKTPGVVRILGVGSQPIPIEDEELESIRVLASSGVKCKPHPFIVGERIEVKNGPLAGVRGTVVRLNLVISITALARSIAVEFDSGAIAPMQSCLGAASIEVRPVCGLNAVAE